MKPAIVLLVVLMLAGCDLESSPSQPNSVQYKFDASPEQQKKREEFVRSAIRNGVIIKVKVPGTNPRMHVGAAWSLLPFDDKQNVASVVYCLYLANATDGSVRIYNGFTGAEIGSYEPYFGLELD